MRVKAVKGDLERNDVVFVQGKDDRTGAAHITLNSRVLVSHEVLGRSQASASRSLSLVYPFNNLRRIRPSQKRHFCQFEN